MPDNCFCRVTYHRINWGLMESHDTITSTRGRILEIAGEMDALFQRQIQLMKSETFVGLTPAQRQEYERIAEHLSRLFRELAQMK